MASERDNLRRQLNATDEQIEIFISRLDGFLQKNLRRLLKDLKAGDRAARETAQVLGGLQTALKELGLEDELRQLTNIYGSQLRHIGEYYADQTGKADVFSDADYATAEALINFDTSLVANKVYALTDDLGAVIFTQVVTGQTPDVDSLIDSFGSSTVANIKTEINTSTAGFSRAITQKKADDLGFDLFIYLGPDDGITRPFCEARVNKIYDKGQIAGWNNGTDLPAGIYLGGYNCRHDLRPISPERAQRLIDSGEAQRG